MKFIGFLIIAAIAVFLWWSDKSIKVTEYRIKDDKFPQSLKNFRILQVSDLQSNRFGKYQRRLIRKVEKLEPDIIVVTGDLIDRNHTNYNLAKDAIIGLGTIAPVYYANGNHETLLNQYDYRGFLYEMEAEMEALLGRAESYHDDELVIGGLDEMVVHKSRNYDRHNPVTDPQCIVDHINEIFDDMKGYRILLAHEPQLLDVYSEAGPDLIFSGHAHGGQIRLPGIGGLYSPEQGIFPKLASGIHSSGNSKMVISRGLGNSRFPFRVFNRPELVMTIME